MKQRIKAEDQIRDLEYKVMKNMGTEEQKRKKILKNEN